MQCRKCIKPFLIIKISENNAGINLCLKYLLTDLELKFAQFRMAIG